MKNSGGGKNDLRIRRQNFHRSDDAGVLLSEYTHNTSIPGEGLCDKSLLLRRSEKTTLTIEL